MKQLIQHLRTGITELVELPVPVVERGHILVQCKCSVISTGTEKMIVEFGKAGWIAKARQQPERVKQVLDKMRNDGIVPTLEAVFRKLDAPLPLGYSNAGVVIGVGEDVHAFKVGDRVVTNGPHAEVVQVPALLAAHIPDTVEYEQAAFAVIASVGMQAIRLIDPRAGDCVLVMGLGLIGQLTCQLLRASGCRVIGCDIDPSRIALARSAGFIAFDSGDENLAAYLDKITAQRGVDAAIITASAKHDRLINQAASLARKKGTIVLTGVVEMQLDRNTFYAKELQFYVSSSYGPGRYDATYEEHGIDYPAAYVRYTAQRNFETVLFAMESGSLHIEPLIAEKIKFQDAPLAYENTGKNKGVATLIRFADEVELPQSIINNVIEPKGTIKAGIIGAGNFTSMTLLPALKKLPLRIQCIVSQNGLHASLLSKKYHIGKASADVSVLLDDPDISLVLITTRHDSHAKLAAQAIEAGKFVYLEKPLAINAKDLALLSAAANKGPGKLIMAGFNRRYAPLALKAASETAGISDLHMHMIVNAGKLPEGHWLNDPILGGGRIIGEACHFIDLMQFFAGCRIKSVFATDNSTGKYLEQTSIHLEFENGASGNILYVANGSQKFPKEEITLIGGGKVLRLHNFRKLEIFGKGLRRVYTSKQDKGHFSQLSRLIQIMHEGGTQDTPFSLMEHITQASFAVEQSIRQGEPVIL